MGGRPEMESSLAGITVGWGWVGGGCGGNEAGGGVHLLLSFLSSHLHWGGLLSEAAAFKSNLFL